MTNTQALDEARAGRFGELKEELRRSLQQHHFDPIAVPLYTFGQLMSALQAPAGKLIDEVLCLKHRLLQQDLATEATRIAANPQVLLRCLLMPSLYRR